LKNILLTGGCGFIGSHTCLLLLERGYRVTILDSLINSNSDVIQRIKLLIRKNNSLLCENLNFKFGDLKDRKFLEDLFYESNSFDGVIHFAGLKAVGESVLTPIKYWENNVYGTINLLSVMDQFQCETIIFSSSATIYGKSFSKINENSFIAPINPYGSTKVAIENLLKDNFNNPSKNWRVINLRYFNPIGAHESGLLGESPKGKPNNIFPLIVKVAAKELKNIMIYGKDWDTRDGTGIRDYIHVMDVAEAHIKSLEFLFNKEKNFLNLNIGTGLGTTVLELINIFEKVNNIKVPYFFTDRREGDTAITIADNSVLKSLLNWEPKRTIEEMCKDGWNWKINQNAKN